MLTQETREKLDQLINHPLIGYVSEDRHKGRSSVSIHAIDDIPASDALAAVKQILGVETTEKHEFDLPHRNATGHCHEGKIDGASVDVLTFETKKASPIEEGTKETIQPDYTSDSEVSANA